MSKGKTFTPTGDRVLVERAPVEEKSSGGILLADSAKETPEFGKVVSYGSRVTDSNIMRGVTVCFSKYAGREIAVNGEKFLLMREDEIEGFIA